MGQGRQVTNDSKSIISMSTTKRGGSAQGSTGSSGRRKPGRKGRALRSSVGVLGVLGGKAEVWCWLEARKGSTKCRL